jgi:hypothetical protein
MKTIAKISLEMCDGIDRIVVQEIGTKALSSTMWDILNMLWRCRRGRIVEGP